MKFKKYVEYINHLAKDKSLLELETVYCTDDEGNSYDTVKYEPGKMNVSGISHLLKERLEVKEVVCIN